MGKSKPNVEVTFMNEPNMRLMAEATINLYRDITGDMNPSPDKVMHCFEAVIGGKEHTPEEKETLIEKELKRLKDQSSMK